MNRLENWFCASSFWRGLTRKELLPWLLAESELGEHVLEIGAGAGAATEELRKRASQVTSLEYSQALVTKLAQRNRRNERGSGPSDSWSEAQGKNCVVVQGDATALPFRAQRFSSVMAVLMLHHLPSREAQDRAFAEASRVLRPGGVFLAIEIENGWLNRVLHIRSTFVPLAPAEISARLGRAGFTGVTVTLRNGMFRIKAGISK